jgi:DNA-directed RNA polymerase subunit RPC12/RpoP
MDNIEVDYLIEVLESGNPDYIGFCLECGAENYGCEPDARKYECEDCGQRAVYGAEECLMML